MDLCGKVRLARREGMSERAAALHFGISRASVKKITSFSVPPGYRRRAEIKRPKLDGFAGFIDQWLTESGLNKSWVIDLAHFSGGFSRHGAQGFV